MLRPLSSSEPERTSTQTSSFCGTKECPETRTSVQWSQKVNALPKLQVRYAQGPLGVWNIDFSDLWHHYGNEFLISEVPVVTAGTRICTLLRSQRFLWTCGSNHHPQRIDRFTGHKVFYSVSIKGTESKWWPRFSFNLVTLVLSIQSHPWSC